MNVVYLDCFNGASGDMILGALIDAGVPEDAVEEALDALGLDETLSVESTMKGAIRATKVTVASTDDRAARSYREIVAWLEKASLERAIKHRSLDVFARLAAAEANIHGTAIEDVHFHEVGSIDAIVDIVGSCAALEHLAPERVLASELPTGRGFARSMHGTIPVPAPAVMELLKGVPLIERGAEELVTPTGAALLSSWCESFGPMPRLAVRAVGYGAGTRDTEIPNVLRVLVGEQQAQAGNLDRAELIETNIDDMAPELMPYVIERLMNVGALDAWVTPILMKKGRNAFTLSVLCEPGSSRELLDVIFDETTTFGVRVGPADRVVLDRKELTVDVDGHPMRIKVGVRDGRSVTIAPEYEDAATIARRTGRPLKEVYERARRAAEQQEIL